MSLVSKVFVFYLWFASRFAGDQTLILVFKCVCLYLGEGFETHLSLYVLFDRLDCFTLFHESRTPTGLTRLWVGSTGQDPESKDKILYLSLRPGDLGFLGYLYFK